MTLTVLGPTSTSASPPRVSSESGAATSGAGVTAPDAGVPSTGVSGRESVSFSPFFFFFLPASYLIIGYLTIWPQGTVQQVCTSYYI